MAEAFADVLAACDEQRSVGVPQIVEANAWDVGSGEDPVEELADRLRVEVAAGGVAEHPVVDPDWDPICSESLSPSLEEVDGGDVELDRSSTCSGLRSELGGGAVLELVRSELADARSDS